MNVHVGEQIKKWRTQIIVVVLVGVTILWIQVLAIEFVELPEDFFYTAAVNSYDNFYDARREVFLGEQRSFTTFSYKTIGGDSKVLNVLNSFDVKTGTGEKIFSVERKYAIDAHTGMHVPSPDVRTRSGYLFGPRMKGFFAQVPDKSSFTYWYVNYDTPIYLRYRDQEEKYGLPVYRYHANFSVDQTKELSNIEGVGKVYGIELDATMQVWVEPYTGRIVAYEDSSEAYYYDLTTRKRLFPWNKFHNNIAQESVATNVAMILAQKQSMMLLSWSVPALCLLAILILLFIRLFRFTTKGSHLQSTRYGVFILPGAVLVFSLLLTIGVFIYFRSAISKNSNAKFESTISHVQDELVAKLDSVAGILRGTKGLFDASTSVEENEWSTFVQSQYIQKNNPGILSLGYARVIKDGTERTLVEYIEPATERNKNNIGVDLSTNPVYRMAMIFARDTGDVALSGIIDGSFVLIIPVYEQGKRLETLLDKRTYISGFVYSVIRSGDFIDAISDLYASGTRVQVYDGPGASMGESADLIYDSYEGEPDTIKKEIDDTLISKINFGGHTWRLVFGKDHSTFYNFWDQVISYAFLFFGMMLSILLTLYVRVFGARRAEAEKIARDITEDIERTKNILEEKLQETERMNTLMINRELRMIELKEEIRKLKRS